MTDSKSFQGQTALVTGASRGLGQAVAVKLAALGAHVILTARTQGGLEDTDDMIRAAGGSASIVPLDLQRPLDIDKLGPSIYPRFNKLDMFLHCAGFVGELAPATHTREKVWTEVVSVNFTATLHLLRSLDPLLRQAKKARAVIATCEAARDPGPFWGGYAASKAGQEAFVTAWAQEVAPDGITARLADPGPMNTKFMAKIFPGIPAEKLQTAEEGAAFMLDVLLDDREDAPFRAVNDRLRFSDLTA